MKYVHGYSEREAARLLDQANMLASLLHEGTRYPDGTSVLEAGCGVGSQTIFLAANSPQARFTSVDISEDSLREAKRKIDERGYKNVSFQQSDIFKLPFEKESFDHIFLCFVLEHLPNPETALAALKNVLKPGGTITVIEGDHGSTFFHPENACARKAIQCLVDLQAAAGGNSLIGRQLYPLLSAAGYKELQVEPKMVYADGGRPDWVEGFTKKTFNAMVEGVKEKALSHNLISPEDWEKGIAGLYRAAAPDGIFCYTFFKAIARK